MVKRRTKSSRKKKQSPAEYMALAGVGLAIIFVLFRGRHTEPTQLAAEAPPHDTTSKQEVQILSPQQSSVDIRKYQEDLNRERAQLARARELGLKTLPLKGQGATVTIPLSFVPEKVWCQGGDLDTMKYASRNDSAKDFVITLEGLDRGGKNPFMRISLEELYKGVNASFTIPRPKEPTAFGLYICSDTRKENSCQRKSMSSHFQMSAQLAETPDKARAEDRMFYFQNLIIDGGSIEAYRTDDFTTEFQRSIGSHLTKRGLSASEFQKAWKTNTTLKSKPVDIRKDRIVLSLPYNDPRCLQAKGR